MTIDRLEFDGDSHESSAHWFGMTMLFDARSFICKFQFSALPRKADLNIHLFCILYISIFPQNRIISWNIWIYSDNMHLIVKNT